MYIFLSNCNRYGIYNKKSDVFGIVFNYTKSHHLIVKILPYVDFIIMYMYMHKYTYMYMCSTGKAIASLFDKCFEELHVKLISNIVVYVISIKYNSQL